MAERPSCNAGYIVRELCQKITLYNNISHCCNSNTKHQPTRPANSPDTKSYLTSIHCLLVQLYNIVCCVVHMRKVLGLRKL